MHIPTGIHEDDFFERYLSTADALFFSLGNNKFSTLVRILRSFGIQQGQLTYFAGDLLFNLLDHKGQTINEIGKIPIEINKIAEKLNKEPELARLPIDLSLISKHAQRSGLLTVTLVCGLEKLEIAKAVCSRPEPVCNVLITDVDLAEGLLESE